MKFFIYALFISMLLHLSLVLLTRKENHEATQKQSHSETISIHMQDTPTKKSESGSASLPHRHLGHRNTTTLAAPHYSDFLLKDTGSSVVDDGTQDEFSGYHGKPYNHIIAASTDFEARLKIPFILRKDLDDGAASVELERLSAHSYKIVALSGNPFLRAALYQAVFDRKNRKLFFEIFDNMHSDFFTIRAIFQTMSYLRPNDDDFDEKITLKEQEIDMIYLHKKFLSPVHPMPNAITLINYQIPDEDAERSRRHDEADRDELTRSPAYLHDIHDLVVE